MGRFEKNSPVKTKQLAQETPYKIKTIPQPLIRWLIFLSLNVLLQFVADLVLKILSFTTDSITLPWRTDFFFLAALSALLGYQAFRGLREEKFTLQRSSAEVGILVEIALAISDLHFLFQNESLWPQLLYLRLPFILLTTFNVFILLLIANKLDLFKSTNKNYLFVVQNRKQIGKILVSK